MLSSCSICPRQCRVNRLNNQTGYCKTGLRARVYSSMLHHGEEPPISGSRGSGTIFFSGCSMACVYCQNFEFSQSLKRGKEVSTGELCDIMLALQKEGAHNINLVTPTHVMPQILAAVEQAAATGLVIPLVYNTGGYELPQMIDLLDGIVDIYLPDMRYADETHAVELSSAPDYPRLNRSSVLQMHRQVGVAKINREGIIERGLIIRHLVLPHGASGTDQTMRFIADELSPDTYISLMSQYQPCYKAGDNPKVSRRISLQEYEAAHDAMNACGLYNGWVQESGGLDRFLGTHIKSNI
jgi:putative pyruvate formate lyase activating enzyme